MKAEPLCELHLSEDEPWLIRLMIDYFYTLTYSADRAVVKDKIPIRADVTNLPSSPIVGDKERSSTMILPQKTPVSTMRWSQPSAALRQSANKNMGYHVAEAAVASSPRKPAKEKISALVVHAEMYALADRFAIGGLKVVAQKKFEAAANILWRCSNFPPIIHTHQELLKKPEVALALKEINSLAFELLNKEWSSGDQKSAKRKREKLEKKAGWGFDRGYDYDYEDDDYAYMPF
ncbi:hypothetical protein MMC25_004113 [Agyrium rufum]|nr:hypothetical protein [Agyrium rufum]